MASKTITAGLDGTFYTPFPILGLAADGADHVLCCGGGGALSAKEVPNVVQALRYNEATLGLSTVASLSTEKQVVIALSYCAGTGLYLASLKGSCAVLEFDIAALTITELYRFETEKEGKEPEQNTAVGSKDGKLIATGGTDGVLQIWKAADPQQPPVLSVQCQLGEGFNKGQREVKELMFNEDGTRVLSCDGTGVARIWDTANGKQVLELKYARASGNLRDPFQIKQAKFLSNGNIVTAPSTQRGASYICVYDATGKVLAEKRVAKTALRSIALSPAEDFLGVCMLDGAKMVFSLPELRLLKNKKLAHDLPATGVGFVGESTLVSGSGDRVINLMRFSKSGEGGFGFVQLVITLLIFLATLYFVLRIGVTGAAIQQGQKGEL